MSSRRKGKQEDDDGSNRNLDGRRIRTVNEAKALTEYLALKPGMEEKKRKAQLQRWQRAVEAAEKREEELKKGEGHGKIEGAWIEEKDDVLEKARDAVSRAVKKGNWKDGFLPTEASSSGGSGGSASPSSEDSDDQMQDEDEDDAAADDDDAKVKSTSVSKATFAPTQPPRQQPPKFFGFDDEDDELLTDEEDQDEEEAIKVSLDTQGKGKGKEKAH